MTYNRKRYLNNIDEFYKFFSIGSVFEVKLPWITFDKDQEYRTKIGDLILITGNNKVKDDRAIRFSVTYNRVEILHVNANIKEHIWIDSDLAVKHEIWLTKISED